MLAVESLAAGVRAADLVARLTAPGTGDLVDRVLMAEQVMSWAKALQAEALARLAPLPGPDLPGPDLPGPDLPGPDWLSDRTFAEFEVGAALVWSKRQASRRIDDALTLVSLPRVLAMLRAGLIDMSRAGAIAGAMTDYLQPGADPRADAARWGAVERTVCERAADRTATQLRGDVARAALKVDPDLAERRRRKAKLDRRVECFPRPDGMAGIEATLSAEEAAIVDTVLTLLADGARDAAARAGSPDQRTHDQRRADAFTGLFTAILNGTPLPIHLVPITTVPWMPPADGADATRDESQFGPVDLIPESFVRSEQQPERSGDADEAAPTGWLPVPARWEPPALPRQQRRRPHLVITVHADTLTGRDDLPGELAGYGAIGAEAARDLARQAGTVDLIVLGEPPGCGSTGPRPPDRYRPHDQLIRDVVAQHGTCRAPGCTRRAEQCDLDHVKPYSASHHTCACNLLPLCRTHHRLKTFGGWQLSWTSASASAADAVDWRTVEWTSPAGRRYVVPPPDLPGSANW